MRQRSFLTSFALLLCGTTLSARALPPASNTVSEATHEPWLDAVLGGRATGQVRNLKGVAVEGAQVRVIKEGEVQEFHTDAQGRFALEVPDHGLFRFEVQSEGYEFLTREIAVSAGKWPRLRFVLKPLTGATVEVTTGMMTTMQPSLRDEIIRTEVISPLEIRRTNAASLNEAVDGKPGIAVQTECSICNVRNVVLNNLPGRFTTILLDGVPLFSSVSGAYGLDMIGVNGVESIDVSRGAGGSLIAPEALSGTVNVVSRHPEKRETVVEVQGGDGGYKRLDGFWAKPFQGGAMTASFLGLQQASLDANGNGVSEYAGFKRYLAGVGLFLEDAAGFKVRGRLDMVDERRGGGALGDEYGAIKRELLGNPFDWLAGQGGSPDARGWIRPDGDFDQALLDGQHPLRLVDGRVLIPYNGGRGGFSEIIFTQRQQGLVVAERDLGDNRRLHLAAGVANHDQDSFYEGDLYVGRQRQYYLEGGLQWIFGNTLLTGGFNYRYEDLRSHGALVDGTAVRGLDDYAYRTPAFFAQAYHVLWNGLVELNASLRYDRNNVFGSITTPRFNALWHHTDRIHSRLAVGRGFRLPTSFFEQDHGILATTRIERLIHDPEISDNASYTFTLGAERCALVASATYNRIKNFARLDSGAIDVATGQKITLFTQAHDPLVVKGLDATFTCKLLGHVEGTLGAESYRYEFAPGTLSFARPHERAYVRFDYDGRDWMFLARATWTGTMDLKRFYDYEHHPRFNLDGTRKLDRSPAYWTVDLNASYRFAKNLSAVMSVNNLFDFRQTDREDFLWVRANGTQDVTHIWGPGRGRSVQAGVRWAF
ncbi:MAG: TonB-dependent receptor [Firmicutes bacterium]|nr:TonB-dependent receptor [Bacillota bacterium]